MEPWECGYLGVLDGGNDPALEMIIHKKEVVSYASKA